MPAHGLNGTDAGVILAAEVKRHIKINRGLVHTLASLERDAQGQGWGDGVKLPILLRNVNPCAADVDLIAQRCQRI
jgi:hypothetical protein